MDPDFSARAVAFDVLSHLERRRQAIAGDEALVRGETTLILDEQRAAYVESGLPAHYFDALYKEILDVVPAAWRAEAEPFTALEKRSFGLWRGGDPVARIAYVFAGLVVGGLCVELPFIPIWEKWFPFLLAIAAFWLPDLQVTWARRRYANSIGRLVAQIASAQPRLDAQVTVDELLANPPVDSLPPAPPPPLPLPKDSP